MRAYSARSQMAEALLKKLAGGRFEVESAGFEPGTLNLFAVRAMADMGIDISKNATKRVFDLYRQGRLYTYVVTVCDETAAGKCPVFPGVAKTINWSFPDPSGFTGTDEEKLEKTIQVRDAIRKKTEDWLEGLDSR